MSFTPSISTSGPVLDPAAGPITGSDQTNTSSSGLPSQSCNVLPAGAGIRSASAANGNLSASTPGAQANPGDGKLADCTEKWWPASFTQLYDKLTVLEDDTSTNEAYEQVKLSLETFGEYLVDGLTRFNASSAASRAAIQAGGFLVNDKPSKVKTTKIDLRPVVNELGDLLGLDEVQCFVLLRRVQKQDQISLQAKCTASLLLRVSQYYFAERECLLKCLQWLLLKGLLAEPGVSQDDPDLPADVRLARATLDKLTERGLEEKLVEQLRANLQGKSVVSTPPSSQAGRQVLEYWAGQPGLEATYLLENVFLLYYSDHAGMQASRFVQLANLFNASLFSVWPVLAAQMGVAAEGAVRRLRHLGVMVLMEGFHIERLLEMMRLQTPMESSDHPLVPHGMQAVHACLQRWTPTEESAPVLLAWAAVLQLAGSVGGARDVPDAGQLALDAQAPQALLHLVQAVAEWEAGSGASSGPRALLSHSKDLTLWVARMGLRDPIGAGRKSVLKNLLITILLAFEFDLEWLVNTFCMLHEGERELCEQFWDGDAIEKILADHILIPAFDRLLSDPLPLLRVLGALAEGPTAGWYCLNFTLHASTMPRAPPILTTMLSRLQTNVASQAEAEAALVLLERLLQGGEHLTRQVCGLLTQPSPAATPSTQPLGLAASAACTVLGITCACTDLPSLHLTALCLRIMARLAGRAPNEALSQLGSTPLLALVPGSSWGDMLAVKSGSHVGFAEGGCMPKLEQLLQSGECPAGVYSATLALLDLVASLVKRGVRQLIVSSLLAHVLWKVLVPQARWRYRNRLHRWQLCAATLRLLGAVLAQPEDSLVEGVRASLSNDEGCASAVLAPLALDASTIDQLWRQSGGSCDARVEVAALEEAILASVEVVGKLLAPSLATVAGARPPARAPTALQRALFSAPVGGRFTPVASLASFTAYKFGPRIHCAAIKTLALLCSSAASLLPRPLPITTCLPNLTHSLPTVRSSMAQGPSEEPASDAAARAALVDLLAPGRARSQPREFCAVAELLLTAVRCQPDLAELLFFNSEDAPQMAAPANPLTLPAPAATTTSARTAKAAPAASGAAEGGALDHLWSCVRKGGELWRDEPMVLSRALCLMRALWQAGHVFYKPMDSFRQRAELWACLEACLPPMSHPEGGETPAPNHKASDKADDHNDDNGRAAPDNSEAFRLLGEAATLDVIGLELLGASAEAPGSGVGGAATAADESCKELIQVVRKWSEPVPAGSEAAPVRPLGVWVSRWVKCRFDAVAVERAHVLAMHVALRLAAFLETSPSDAGGLHAGLAASLRAASASLMTHPSAVNLMAAKGFGGKAAHKRAELLTTLADALMHMDVGGNLYQQEHVHCLLEAVRATNMHTLLLRQASCTAALEFECEAGFQYDVEWLEEALGPSYMDQPDPSMQRLVRAAREVNAMLTTTYAQLEVLQAARLVLSVAAFARRAPEQSNTSSQATSLFATWPRRDAGRAALEAAMAVEQAGASASASPAAAALTLHLARVLLLLLRIWGGSAPGPAFPTPNGNSATSPSDDQSLEEHGMCLAVVRCVVTVVENEVAQSHESAKTLGPPLLAALLAILQIARKVGGEKGSRSESTDAMQRGTRDMLCRVLPLLCARSAQEGYGAVAFAVIQAIVENGGAGTWLPIMQSDLRLPLLQMMGDPTHGVATTEAALGLCATVVRRSRGAAAVLRERGIMQQLATLAGHLEATKVQEKTVSSGVKQTLSAIELSRGGAVGVRYGEKGEPAPMHRIWCLMLAVAGALTNALFSDETFMEEVVSFMSTAESMLLLSLQPASGPQGTQLTLRALEEAELAAFLLCQFFPMAGRWQMASPHSSSEFCRVITALLSFIARPQTRAWRCDPVGVAENQASAKRNVLSEMVFKHGWFAVAGDSKSSFDEPKTMSGDQKPLAICNSSNRLGACPGQHSENLALRLYGAARHYTAFLCTVASYNSASSGVRSHCNLPTVDELEEIQKQCETVLEAMGSDETSSKSSMLQQTLKGICESVEWLVQLQHGSTDMDS